MESAIVSPMAGGRGNISNPSRAYPPPESPWIMAMDWADLLFMHWRIAPDRLRLFVPPQLEIETFDGSAWLGIVPFEMRGTRARFTPPVPGLSRFPELNVRTYVRPAAGTERPARGDGGGAGGVWFFSLDATSRAAVEAARLTFGLPYFRAAMSIVHEGEWILYTHERRDQNERLRYGTPHPVPARFRARYRPTGPVQEARPGSLESFLTDRYRLYAWGAGGGAAGRIYSGEIHHPPWPLQPAEAQIEVNTMIGFLGIDTLDTAPLLHFSRFVKVAAWRPRAVQIR
jgi:uncharacterized protein